MYIVDHKPALVMAVTSIYTAAVHAAQPPLAAVAHVSVIVEIDQWVRLLGGIAGMLAGFASAAWYGYSFLQARRGKKTGKDEHS